MGHYYAALENYSFTRYQYAARKIPQFDLSIDLRSFVDLLHPVIFFKHFSKKSTLRQSGFNRTCLTFC